VPWKIFTLNVERGNSFESHHLCITHILMNDHLVFSSSPSLAFGWKIRIFLGIFSGLVHRQRVSLAESDCSKYTFLPPLFHSSRVLDSDFSYTCQSPVLACDSIYSYICMHRHPMYIAIGIRFYFAIVPLTSARAQRSNPLLPFPWLPFSPIVISPRKSLFMRERKPIIN
jgi:hypothetical protein